MPLRKARSVYYKIDISHAATYAINVDRHTFHTYRSLLFLQFWNNLSHRGCTLRFNLVRPCKCITTMYAHTTHTHTPHTHTYIHNTHTYIHTYIYICTHHIQIIVDRTDVCIYFTNNTHGRDTHYSFSFSAAQLTRQFVYITLPILTPDSTYFQLVMDHIVLINERI